MRSRRWIGWCLCAMLGAAVTAAGFALVGSGAFHSEGDQRDWFRGFVSRSVSELGPEFGLHSTVELYIGECDDERADVSWLASLANPPALHDPDFSDADAQAHNVQAQLLRISGLFHGDTDPIVTVPVIPVGEDGDAGETFVFIPSQNSRIQVSTPLGISVLAVGYVHC